MSYHQYHGDTKSSQHKMNQGEQHKMNQGDVNYFEISHAKTVNQAAAQ
jgi:hypothetical protein